MLHRVRCSLLLTLLIALLTLRTLRRGPISYQLG